MEYDLTDEEIRKICRRYSLSVVVAHGIRDGLSGDMRRALAGSVRVNCWPAVEALLNTAGVLNSPRRGVTGVQYGSNNVQTNHF